MVLPYDQAFAPYACGPAASATWFSERKLNVAEAHCWCQLGIAHGGKPAGVYTVDPDFDGNGVVLTCEMDIDGGGWSQMTGAYLSGLSSGTSREYLYTVGDVYTASAAWYISPSNTAIWNWSSYQPVNGTYHYATSGHSPTGSFSCTNNEQGQSGIGCSNGAGNNLKCFVPGSSTYQDPQHGLATICQDQPNVFNMGGACHSPVQVWVR